MALYSLSLLMANIIKQSDQKYTTRIEFINEEYPSKRIIALTIDDLEKFMKDNF